MLECRRPGFLDYRLSVWANVLRGWLSRAPGAAPARGGGAALADGGRGGTSLGRHRGQRFPRASSPWRAFLTPWYTHAVLPYAGPSLALLLISHMGTSFTKIFCSEIGRKPFNSPLLLLLRYSCNPVGRWQGLPDDWCSGLLPLSTCLTLRKFFLIRSHVTFLVTLYLQPWVSLWTSQN